jgi:hypothetical protein|nr:hypothetical protein [Phocaeicola coprophilus]
MRGTDVERFNAETGYWLAEAFWNQGIASVPHHFELLKKEFVKAQTNN